MKLERISTSNETFYYGFSGKKTTDIRVDVKLDHEVDEKALNLAVKNIVMRYPHLSKKLVVKGGNIFYAENEKEPTAYPWKQEECYLGTEDTGYFLFRVVYRADEIIFSIHHGVTDGKGVIQIMKTLLSDYAWYRKGKIRKELCEGAAPELIEDVYEKYGNIEQEPFYMVRNNGAYVIPEPYYSEEDTSCRRLKITCSMKDLLKVSKRSQSTPVPVLAAMISEAVESLYEIGEQPITGYIPVNLRPMFQSETLCNSSIAITLPYSPRLKEKDMDLKCTALRGIMDLQIQRENFIYRMGRQIEMGRQREALDMPAEMKQKIYVDRLTKGSRSLYTYLLTYVGEFTIPEEAASFVKDLYFSIPAYLVPLSILASADKEVMRLSCTQNFKTDAVVKKIVEIMKKKGVQASFEDLGEMQTESLEFAKLPHIEPCSEKHVKR